MGSVGTALHNSVCAACKKMRGDSLGKRYASHCVKRARSLNSNDVNLCHCEDCVGFFLVPFLFSFTILRNTDKKLK